MSNIYSQIWQAINKSKNILIHLHPSPDGDCTGGALSLLFVLKQLKKKVTIISGDSEAPKYLASLPGFEYIKNQNFSQTDLNKFDLFILQDTAATTQISKQSEVIIPKTLKTIVIDHHDTNPKFGDINLVNTDYPATCQILFDLFKSNKNIKITKNIALNLLIGIYTDTGGFKYPKTTFKTFEILSELTKINPNFHQQIFDMENSDSPDRLKFLSLILGSIETHFSSNVAIASISFETIQKNNISQKFTTSSDVANMLKSVIGWNIGVCLIETQPNVVKMSFRTRDSEKYDVSKIALELGGGGLKAAAGATLQKSLPESKKSLLQAIKSIYPKL